MAERYVLFLAHGHLLNVHRHLTVAHHLHDAIVLGDEIHEESRMVLCHLLYGGA